jgi:T-complex protein 1 subunit epsilon
MDKILTSSDGELVVTNDGATIMEKMELNHQAAKLLCQLSKSQDDEIGDGTTGVVVIAGALLDKCLYLLDKGLHPLNIARGFEKAAECCMKTIESTAQTVDITNKQQLIDAAVTTLGSKVVNEFKLELAKVCVDAVLAVADLNTRDVNFDLIKVEGKVGGNVGNTELYSGIILDKEFSHPQMELEINDCKIAILTCPFEPPKPKTKNRLEIRSAED